METPVDLGDSTPEVFANQELSHREDGRGDGLPTRAVGRRGLREDLRQPGQELIQLIEAEATAWRVETHNHVQFVVGKQLEQGKGVKDATKFTHDPQCASIPQT